MNSRGDRRILCVELNMKTVVRRRGHDLAGVGDGTQQKNVGYPEFRRIGRDLLDPFLYLIEMCDDRIASRQGPTHPWQEVQRRRYVAHNVSLDQSKLVVVKPAQAHRTLLRESRVRRCE